ncbi:sigma-70 family RNA polymerase sigma factor [Bacillus sp. 31A1R]|uniref:Sigma-70 family RNA polymerase sigma factor n=1 Tax=Robertmurraya mangrovi TaxID=3098077 RepID=A0ABU5IXX8_9BACI|nr:sigma-70 family RNA polymerase sigma factor [Bacillus sp. 31A1R]MDZ5472013.1 sigma-70 family RNA polymerase sigma factor [Bacillus sp. 31A1R]
MNHLVKKAQKGDKKAFITLLQQYEEDIYRMAYVYVRNKDDALDVVQETAYRSFSKIGALKQPEYFKTWLLKITINAALDLIRKEKKVVQLVPELIESVSLEEDMNLSITLKDVMEKLSENEKSIVLLKYYYDHTFIEISNIVDIPLGTVKSILYRALGKLRTHLKEDDICEN